MGGLVIVSIEGLARFDAVFFHEANAPDGIGMQHLLVRGYDLAAELIVVRGNWSHLMFHNFSPRYAR
jgi:hypothetical protein